MSLAKRPAVLDTDIGTDVDDILALALMVRAPELDLIGVTTVYGDTTLRARMARFVCDNLGRPDVVVAAGERQTLTDRPVWWAGHEGKGIPDIDAIAVDESSNGVDYLIQVAREHAGALELYAIGPLTNVARAIQADASFASSLRRLYVMGGAFWMEKPEHNIKCDPEAADVVFRSGIPMTVSGLDVTTKVWFREPEVRAIGAANGVVGKVLEDEIRTWWAFRNSDRNNPHDPLAVLAALEPDLFRFEQCDVHVGLGEEDLARTYPENCGSGSIAIAAEVDTDAAEKAMVRRITAEG